MAKNIGIVVTGVSGRMGQMILDQISKTEGVFLAGALEAPNHNWIGQDIGEIINGVPLGLKVAEKACDIFAAADAVIDFTSPEASVGYAQSAAAKGLVHVIGTTGFSKTQIDRINLLRDKIAIIRSGNMSLGVNLLAKITKKVAEVLDDEFDIEIIEAHHNKKVDAPSGTAILLGEAAAEGRKVSLLEVQDLQREGIVGARKRGNIGFTSIRGGDIVGEHDVLFASSSERITLRHVASNRNVFAVGAIKAAIWGTGKSPGIYDMTDVLGV